MGHYSAFFSFMQHVRVASPAQERMSHDLSSLFEAVYAERPILRTLIAQHGTRTLHEYASQYVADTGYPAARRDEIIGVIARETERLFGTELSRTISEQLNREYIVNTADHVGPVTHSWFVSTSALIGATLSQGSRAIITLACSNVSLNNTSFPRGVLFHTQKGSEIREQRLSFLPSDSHAASVYGFRAYTRDEIHKIHKLLREKVRARDVPQSVADKLVTLIDTVYGTESALSQASFADQVSTTNRTLWQHMFSNEQVPELVYLEQERIVIDALTRFHLTGRSVVSKILFNPEYTALAASHFDGVPSAYVLSEKKGTFLFWGASKDTSYRVSLWYKDGALESSDGTVRIPLTPESITRALNDKRIVPSLLLTFILLSFHYGLNCLGGFNQIHYVTAMKAAYLSFLSARGETDEYTLATCAVTDNTNDVTLGYVRDGAALIPADGLDFYLYGTGTAWAHLVSDVHTLTLRDAFFPGMPAFYRCTRPASQLNPTLSTITPAHITEYFGVDKKLTPTVSLS